jgi:hypothetical protein
VFLDPFFALLILPTPMLLSSLISGDVELIPLGAETGGRRSTIALPNLISGNDGW